MNYLFLVTLGPVQDFIASARRTRDLHFGSWFLSELSRAAAYEIYKADGSVLIFPAPENEEALKPGARFNVANRILALIKQDPATLAVEVRKAIFGQLHDIRKQAYTNVQHHLPPEKLTDAYKQIEDLVELAWVALPLPDRRQYYIVRNLLEALMAARKNTHAFAPVDWGAKVAKSSLDGHLESVIPSTEYPDGSDSPQKRREALERLYRRYRIAGLGERLSGVDLLKRFGRTTFDEQFPSTSHIATLPFLQRIKRVNEPHKTTLRKAWESFVSELDAIATTAVREQLAPSYPAHPILDRYDGSLLFENRLVDVLLLPSTDASKNKDFQQARAAQQAFYEKLRAQFSKLPKQPSTYYALLQADGDNMGNLIDALAEQGGELGYEKHRELSLALSRFAARVYTIVVKEHDGALVYSGGDDVLAFLPLHTVLRCASQLQAEFQGALKELARQVGQQPPTLSVGIAIVHHLEPLREVRRLAQEAEQEAKRQEGKNSLAITISKRGGEDYRAVGQWGNIDVRLEQLIDYCREASIPVGMAYELRDLVLRLSVPRNDSLYDEMQRIIRLDTLRILLRKLKVPAGKISDERMAEIEQYLREQLSLPPKELPGRESRSQEPAGASSSTDAAQGAQEVPVLPPVSIDTFINELVIAQTLARAADLAHMPMLSRKEKHHDHLAR